MNRGPDESEERKEKKKKKTKKKNSHRLVTQNCSV